MERVPPQNLDAEENVLGAMLLSPNAITAVADVVRPEDFYRGTHGKIYQAALDLDAKGEPVDALTLANSLEARGWLQEVGGKIRIHELAALAPTAANARHWAEIVKEMAQLRALITAGDEIARLGWERPGETRDLLSTAETALSEAISGSDPTEISQATDGLGDALREIKRAVETGQPLYGLKTWFPEIDEQTLGLRGGQLVTVAARPGMGKSVLLSNVCQNIADNNQPTAIFTLEMSRAELQYRLLARSTDIDARRIRTGKLTPDELKRVIGAAKKLHESPLYIEDSARTVTEMRARARRMKKKFGCNLFAVDYLQLMTADGKADNRQEQVSQISRGLKLVATEMDIPILMACQVNRNTESRDDKRPMLADLRESGAIEQDSDIVIFIYREVMYSPMMDAKDAPTTEIIFAKHRGGETGTVKLLFNGRRQTFQSPARRDVPDEH